MNISRLKDLMAVSIALAIVSIAVYLIMDWDTRVMQKHPPFTADHDTSIFRPTRDEVRIAQQFSDTTLPHLTGLGLVKHYSRTEIETIITVSGSQWKERSPFFKESLLEQIHIYNKVKGYAVQTKIIDDQTSVIYAEIIPPDRKIIY
jgi:hypothetical protein